MKALLIFLIFLSNLALQGQTKDIVKSDGITGSLHQSNIGKITFMEKIIPIEDYTEAGFLRSFVLNEMSDFNIRVFLGNSLTNYLHALAPELSAEELTQKGNYQVSFYVDNILIYKENLNAGAGSAESKNIRTVFRVPLISSTDEDSWGRFLWNRFMFKGGEEALTGGNHTLKIEIRPYLQTGELKVGDIIAEGEIKIIIPQINVTEDQVKIRRIEPGSGWEISTDMYDSAKIRELNKKIAAQEFKNIMSIIVIKNGKLLLEEYFNGAGRDTLHDTRSVGKSFASALTGIAIRDGYLESENQQLNEFYNLRDFLNYSPEKENVTIKNLLTMTSAFEGSDMDEGSPGNEENMYPSDNWLNFTLNLPLDSSKVVERRWDYFTAGVVLLGDILNKSVPGGLEKYADETLFKPLQISEYSWQYTPQNTVSTAGGLRLRSLDLAKFGQLYKNGGIWMGKQILLEEWAGKSLTKQAGIAGTEDEFYGYLFWNKAYMVNDRAYEVFYSSGNGGNKIFIFKDKPVVIVITSTAYNKPYSHSQADKIMQNYLIPVFAE